MYICSISLAFIRKKIPYIYIYMNQAQEIFYDVKIKQINKEMF